MDTGVDAAHARARAMLGELEGLLASWAQLRREASEERINALTACLGGLLAVASATSASALHAIQWAGLALAVVIGSITAIYMLRLRARVHSARAQRLECLRNRHGGMLFSALIRDLEAAGEPVPKHELLYLDALPPSKVNVSAAARILAGARRAIERRAQPAAFGGAASSTGP